MRRLATNGIVPGTNVTFAVDYGQGETDTSLGTSQAAYASGLSTLISAGVTCGMTGRWFISRESWISGGTSANVQNAQTAAVNGTNIFAGANMDSLNATNRLADNTHLNDTGMTNAAALKVSAYAASGAPF